MSRVESRPLTIQQSISSRYPSEGETKKQSTGNRTKVVTLDC